MNKILKNMTQNACKANSTVLRLCLCPLCGSWGLKMIPKVSCQKNQYKCIKVGHPEMAHFVLVAEMACESLLAKKAASDCDS